MKLLYPAQSLSVVGITEVLFKLRTILKALRGLKKSLEQGETGSHHPDRFP